MPELPEVETIARALRQGGRGGESLPGRRVRGAQLLWERSLATPSPAAFLREITGQRVEDVQRRGKFLIIHLENKHLLIHLRMSGDLRVEAQTAPVLPHDRAIVDFEDGMRLAFNDARKFGRLWLVDDPQAVVGALGPEPFAPDFDAQALYRRLQGVQRQIKPLLLDQHFIAGLGNIYTDEALHTAQIHPLTPSNRLTLAQAERLLAAMRAVLQEGIRRNGASIDWVYRGGEFQNDFRVYQRTGQPCPVCQTPIQRLVVGQRGTHFCPVCQTLDAHG